ncbi:MAG TPA: UTP--glucose-1-phosphate uridylyltransferase [Spirochaetota bacterium]|mgnify:FL=1|nr:UTP--glucose-1-phosphate uridylyltransferase [Spirochaetota bacterium]HOL56671.1 UTP--glucose-1-phosphate uridylyltransferase [Spirochaetota bacterium]HPP03307.1 UTP--glucose-1-phosphate uridylyltransferase [Spirochaetota bacterium]
MNKISGRNKNEQMIIEKFINNNNSHIFYFWDELNDSEKDNLIEELKKVDIEAINIYYNNYKNKKIEDFTFEPTEYFSIEDRIKYPEISDIGENALRKGEVAFLTVAGGQGSRLGFDAPKGCFPVSPIKKKSLFQIFAEKIKFYSCYYNYHFKWFIMTSEDNNKDTVDFFSKNNYFGLIKENVVFFTQNMLPSVTLDNKLILAEKSKLFRNPDGHGGILTAFFKSGLLKDIKKAGIRHISYFQVDNPLIDMADPFFIGYHIYKNSEVTTKVIKKLYPEEKLGSIGKKNGRNAIIEYSDIPKELMYAKNDDGSLKFLMGSIGVHVFDVDFLLNFTEKLPVHTAKKKTIAYDFYGDIPQKKEIDVLKFETFVFDTITLSKRSAFFETLRDEEFYPLKNKSGVDSIETCIKGQISLHYDWLLKTQFVTQKDSDKIYEISPLFAPSRRIFIEKKDQSSDKIKEAIFNKDGTIKDEIYIE